MGSHADLLRPCQGSCKKGTYCRFEHPPIGPSTVISNEPQRKASASSLCGPSTTISHESRRTASVLRQGDHRNNKGLRAAPPSVLGKRPAAGSVNTAPNQIKQTIQKPQSNPLVDLRENTNIPPLANHSQAPATRSDSIMDSTVFDNKHASAPASLHTMIGKPFHELQRCTWLTDRPYFTDVEKLLTDAFFLRKFDNHRCNGPDRAMLGQDEKSNIEAQWRLFVLLAVRKKLVPYEQGSDEAEKLIRETVLEGEMNAETVKERYDDVRMPLQMRIFAEQVMGYSLGEGVSEAQWEDLLKFEEWEWTGNGFEWKAIFGQG